jgi:hypothetical protein
MALSMWAIACGGSVSSPAEAPTSSARTEASPFTGDLQCAYGAADCNPCVPDVRSAFLRLGGGASAKFRYRSRENQSLPPLNKVLPGFTFTDHVQSFARVPGVGDENWLVGTRSQPNQPNGRAGFFMVHMSALAGSGGEAFAAVNRQVSAKNQGTEFFYPMYGTDHPGGAQVLGRIYAIGAECAGNQFFNKYLGKCSGVPFVEFYDLSDPSRVQKINRLTLDGARGEHQQRLNAQRGNKGYATAVALTRLSDKRYLLLALGKDRRAEGWFYVSDGPSISATTEWRYLQYWSRRSAEPSRYSWGRGYQNINFVNECETGQIYAVAMGLDRTEQRADLFRLIGKAESDSPSTSSSQGEQRSLSFNHEAEITLRPFDGNYCSVRAGSGVHVTPSGKMILYCSTRRSAKRMLKFEEYAGEITSPEPVRSASLMKK